METSSIHWIHKEINYGETISHECCCSNCGYAVMRYSHLIYDLRAGKPYDAPKYNYCPNCGEGVAKNDLTIQN